jgi:hypothetical protein
MPPFKAIPIAVIDLDFTCIARTKNRAPRWRRPAPLVDLADRPDEASDVEPRGM